MLSTMVLVMRDCFLGILNGNFFFHLGPADLDLLDLAVSLNTEVVFRLGQRFYRGFGWYYNFYTTGIPIDNVPPFHVK
jgi:hypothetical protein